MAHLESISELYYICSKQLTIIHNIIQNKYNKEACKHKSNRFFAHNKLSSGIDSILDAWWPSNWESTWLGSEYNLGIRFRLIVWNFLCKEHVGRPTLIPATGSDLRGEVQGIFVYLLPSYQRCISNMEMSRDKAACVVLASRDSVHESDCHQEDICEALVW